MPVEHGGAIDALPVAVQRGAHHEVLHEDMRRAVRSELRRQGPDMAGPQAVAIHDNRNLDAASFRQVLDQPCVPHIAVDQLRLACHHRMDDDRAVFHAALQRKALASEQLAAGLGIALQIALAAADVFVDRHVVLGDLVVPAQEIGRVLRGVLARLADEPAKMAQQLEADLVLREDLPGPPPPARRRG